MTEDVVKCLDGAFDVIPGHGGDRNQYLREHNVKTFLIDGTKSNQKLNGHTNSFRGYVYCKIENASQIT